jgi:hypothetical protein
MVTDRLPEVSVDLSSENVEVVGRRAEQAKNMSDGSVE